jgi:L-2-hydroxyglutarate oxidase LhgO
MSDHVGFARIFIDLINENDNRPIFSQPVYNISLPENTPTGTPLIRILVSTAGGVRAGPYVGEYQTGDEGKASLTLTLPHMVIMEHALKHETRIKRGCL